MVSRLFEPDSDEFKVYVEHYTEGKTIKSPNESEEWYIINKAVRPVEPHPLTGKETVRVDLLCADSAEPKSE